VRDMQRVFPLALEPIPSDLAAIVSDPIWNARSASKMERKFENEDQTYASYGTRHLTSGSSVTSTLHTLTMAKAFKFGELRMK
jgi:hypothetical protein